MIIIGSNIVVALINDNLTGNKERSNLSISSLKILRVQMLLLTVQYIHQSLDAITIRAIHPSVLRWMKQKL